MVAGTSVNGIEIAAALGKVGIAPGDCLIVHSSLSSIGWVNGGADTVIDAFLGVLGPEGTLAMPTLEHLVVERSLRRVSPGVRERMLDRLRGWNRPGVWAGFDRLRLQADLDRSGHLSRAGCGAATLIRTPARGMVDDALREMEKAPGEWFGGAFCGWMEGEAADGP